jgi:hypothetical protein
MKLKYIFASLLAVWALAGEAKIVGKSMGAKGAILLQDDPCDEMPSAFKMTVIDLAAKPIHFGCWILNDGIVYLASPTMGQGAFPADGFEWFKKTTTRSSWT